MNYTDFSNADTFYDTIFKNYWSLRVFKCWKTITLVDRSFPKSKSYLKAQSVSIGNKSVSHFPWSNMLNSFIYEEMAKYPSLGNHHFLSTFLSSKNSLQSKKIKVVSSGGSSSIAPMLFSRQPLDTQYAEKVFYAFFPVNDNTLKRQAIKWWDWIHCCSRTYNRSSTKPTEYCLYNKSGVRAVTKAARIVTTYWHTLISAQ